MKLVVEDFETGDQVELPSKVEVCHRCNGSGVHDHPAFANGISPEQFAEDPDFAEDYSKGRHDVQCTVCNGLRVVAGPDEEGFTPEHARIWKDHCDALSERASERRMREAGIQF